MELVGILLYTVSANNIANSVTFLKQRFSTGIVRLSGILYTGVFGVSSIRDATKGYCSLVLLYIVHYCSL